MNCVSCLRPAPDSAGEDWISGAYVGRSSTEIGPFCPGCSVYLRQDCNDELVLDVIRPKGKWFEGIFFPDEEQTQIHNTTLTFNKNYGGRWLLHRKHTEVGCDVTRSFLTLEEALDAAYELSLEDTKHD